MSVCTRRDLQFLYRSRLVQIIRNPVLLVWVASRSLLREGVVDHKIQKTPQSWPEAKHLGHQTSMRAVETLSAGIQYGRGWHSNYYYSFASRSPWERGAIWAKQPANRQTHTVHLKTKCKGVTLSSFVFHNITPFSLHCPFLFISFLKTYFSNNGFTLSVILRVPAYHPRIPCTGQRFSKTCLASSNQLTPR